MTIDLVSKRGKQSQSRRSVGHFFAKLALALIACNILPPAERADAQPLTTSPTPYLDASHPGDWVFVYKFNASPFPTTKQLATCIFGGTPDTRRSSQAFAFASSNSSALANGAGLMGATLDDPLGATFNAIYSRDFNFVAWNDQFYNDSKMPCGSCSRWRHSKGILAWDGSGNGVIVQVSNPDWPGAGSSARPRLHEGSTLGCDHATNNILVGQHFFALKLTPADTSAVLDALINASIITNVSNPQIARIIGPPELVAKASQLGRRIQSVNCTDVTLSSGVRLISKASDLWVPPWQLISARLGVPLRTSTWRANSPIPTTTDKTVVRCWRPSLGTPRAAEIATTGKWSGKVIKMSVGGSHAKLGVSLDPTQPFTIFGDMNQQGSLVGNCGRAQNGRGGLFFVLTDPELYAFMQVLLDGGTALRTVPKKKQKVRTN